MSSIRDRKKDIARALLIILVVLGHTDFVGKHFIYLFHVPAFFIISGLFYKKEKIKDTKDVKNFVVKRIKRLYIPYIMFNLAALLLNNVLININVYGLETHEYYNIQKIAIEAVKILCFCGTQEIVGATWFLRILFFIEVLYCFIEKFLRTNKYEESINQLVAVVFFVMGIVLSVINWSVSLFAPVFTCYFLYLIGNRYIKYVNTFIEKNKWTVNLFISIMMWLILFLFGKVGTIEISKALYTNFWFFAITSVVGWIFIYSISCVIDNIKGLNDILSYVGKESIAILGIHFMAFKVVSFCYLEMNKLDISLLSDFPVIEGVFVEKYLWVFYSLGGILIPIILGSAYKEMKKVLVERK